MTETFFKVFQNEYQFKKFSKIDMPDCNKSLLSLRLV